MRVSRRRHMLLSCAMRRVGSASTQHGAAWGSPLPLPSVTVPLDTKAFAGTTGYHAGFGASGGGLAHLIHCTRDVRVGGGSVWLGPTCACRGGLERNPLPWSLLDAHHSIVRILIAMLAARTAAGGAGLPERSPVQYHMQGV